MTATPHRFSCGRRITFVSDQVSNGVARLTGSIDSQLDRLTALTAARGASGVRAVIDGLEISPPAISSR